MAYKFYDSMANRATLFGALGLVFLSLAFWSVGIDAAIHFNLAGLF